MARAINFQTVSIRMVKEETVSYEGAKRTINVCADIFEVAKRYLEDSDREHLVVFVLNTKNQIIAINTAHIGSLNASVVHPREIMKPVILANGATFILAHNHPSGDPTPSQEDIKMTEQMRDAGKIMGIELLDHIIVGDQCLSMRSHNYAGWTE